MTVDAAIVERIYEAALVPEFWPDLIDGIADATGSASAAALLFSPTEPPRGIISSVTAEAFHRFVDSGAWRQNLRAKKAPEAILFGFIRAGDVLTEEELAGDAVERSLRSAGVSWQSQTLIATSNGDLAGFSAERWMEDGPHSSEQLKRLNEYRPHLARSMLLAARLGLMQARHSVATLAALGLPALVLSAGGRVLETNDLICDVHHSMRIEAFDSFRLLESQSDALLQAAVRSGTQLDKPVVRSIPIPAADNRSAMVAHVLPLIRSAFDIFHGGSTIVAFSEVRASRMVPVPAVLSGLFDLTPAEAMLAGSLSRGETLKAASSAAKVTLKSARTYLDRVFLKTGTHSQGQLVALLKTAGPPN